MNSVKYSDQQMEVIQFSDQGSLFLEGPAGSGKTTASIGRVEYLLKNHPGNEILILVPQKSLAKPYFDFLLHQDFYSGRLPTVSTIGGLARNLILRLWPIIAEPAGFMQPKESPHFLSMEIAQYCLGKCIEPYRKKGYFQSIVIEKSRLYNQLLDNLNKSALVPFPIHELSYRLKNVSNLDTSIQSAYDQAQECAMVFRKYCLENNLLDFSLMLDTFIKHTWSLELCRNLFYDQYHFLIAENIEENVPVAHGFLREWLKNMDSSLMIFDQGGGFRSFLGADPESAYSLKSACDEEIRFDSVLNRSPEFNQFQSSLSTCIKREKTKILQENYAGILEINNFRFYPEMVMAVCKEIRKLVLENHIEPQEIVVISPYLSDALKFSIISRLGQLNIPFYSSRPSHMYANDIVIRALLTFAKMAHPSWRLRVTRFEFRHALMTAIPNLDIIRADLIAQTLLEESNQAQRIRSFDAITNSTMQERITFLIGEMIEKLQGWFESYVNGTLQPLDVFISRIYGEILSQIGFGLFSDFEAANRVSQLVTSIRNFRNFAGSYLNLDEISCGYEYILTLQDGLLPSSIFQTEENQADAVAIEPAHTFLMENRRCKTQFWLDIGSLGWWERLNQPLTNPYVLRQSSDPSRQWTEALEYEANQESMLRVVSGLISRCTEKIIVNSVQTNEHGTEQRGPLLQAFNLLKKRLYQQERNDRV